MKKITGFSLVLGLLAAGSLGCGSSPPPAASTPATTSGTTTTTGTTATPVADKDTDGDGIPDSTDKCPDKKEDGLAPDPKDGCPKS
jgi:OmpA-OmpF porin, OOP family